MAQGTEEWHGKGLGTSLCPSFLNSLAEQFLLKMLSPTRSSPGWRWTLSALPLHMLTPTSGWGSLGTLEQRKEGLEDSCKLAFASAIALFGGAPHGGPSKVGLPMKTSTAMLRASETLQVSHFHYCFGVSRDKVFPMYSRLASDSQRSSCLSLLEL